VGALLRVWSKDNFELLSGIYRCYYKGAINRGQAADTIVTACTTCFYHMDKAVKKDRMELEIYDLPVLVAKAMGIKL